MKKVFQNLKIWQKLTAIVSLLIVPMIMLFIFVNRGINHDIRFNTLERDGNEYLIPVVGLISNISSHRLIQNAQAGTEFNISELIKKIDAGFIELEEVDKRFGVDLRSDSEGYRKSGRDFVAIDIVKSRWQEIRDGNSTDYNLVLSDLRNIITHIGNTSNLILDPDLDSYYLVDVILLVIPQLQKRLSEDVDERSILAAFLKQSDLDRIDSSIEMSLSEDQNFLGVSDSLQKNLPSKILELNQVVEKLVSNLKTDDLPILIASLDVLDTSHKFWKVTVDELNILIETRINNYKYTQKVIYVSFALTLALSLIAVFLLSNNITKSIGKLKNVALEIVNGDINKKAEIDTTEEIGQLAEAFNIMVDRLQENSKNLEAKVDERTTELTKLNQLMIGREIKTTELKRIIEDLKKKII